MNHWLIIGLAAGALGILSFPAFSEPPPGTDPNSAESQWYRSLIAPNTGIMCCSSADCRKVQFRAVGQHYEVLIDRESFIDGDDAWHAVPDEVIIRNMPNPTGEAVACWYGQKVHCFVAPTLT